MVILIVVLEKIRLLVLLSEETLEKMYLFLV